MKINQRMESKWFNEVIAKTLNGEEKVIIERLSEKQINAFGKFMVSDRTDYNGLRSVYDSKDGRYTATMSRRNYCTTLKVYDHVRRNYNQTVLSLKLLREDIEADGGSDEWDLEDVSKYESTLVEFQLILQDSVSTESA